jgi:hypothetical protein
MINLWIALRDDAEAELATWVEDLTADQSMVKDSILSHPDLQHIASSTKRMTDGANTWGMYSMYTSGSPTALGNIAKWLGLYAGKAFVCGAWHMGGLQLGTALDEDGNLIGSPLYPIDPRLVEFMPDDVTYNEDGAELSRTPATEPKQLNLMAGQKPRNFT